MGIQCTWTLQRVQFRPSVLFRCINTNPRPNSLRSSVFATMSSVSTEKSVDSDQKGSNNDTQKPLLVNPGFLISYSVLFDGFLFDCDGGFDFSSPADSVASRWKWVWYCHVFVLWVMLRLWIVDFVFVSCTTLCLIIELNLL